MLCCRYTERRLGGGGDGLPSIPGLPPNLPMRRRYTVFEVIGWRQHRGLPVVRIEKDLPDRYWFGERPRLLKEFRGDVADKLIQDVDRAARTYPWPDTYTAFPDRTATPLSPGSPGSSGSWTRAPVFRHRQRLQKLMCLIAFAIDCHPAYSLVLVANRDEFRARATEPAGFWTDAPHVLAGRDRQAGGTWIG